MDCRKQFLAYLRVYKNYLVQNLLFLFNYCYQEANFQVLSLCEQYSIYEDTQHLQ